MKVFSVFGITYSGKTTTIENIIRELRSRGHSVGSVKEIHHNEFTIDREGTNTYRHKEAGAQLVTARGLLETDMLFQEMLPVQRILNFYDQDFVVLEGVTDCSAPKIICAHTTKEIDERLDDTVFAISGIISNSMKEYKGIPVINSIDNIEQLVDLIEKKVYERLPDFDMECCSACGYGCRGLGIKILRGEASVDDCVIKRGRIKLYIGGKPIDMVPFVQNILCNTIKGVVSQLDGYTPGAPIEIKIGDSL